MDCTEEVYRRTVREVFSSLKETARFDDMVARSIALPNGEGFLSPVCDLSATDSELIEKLASWRAANSLAFPTQFPVTIDGTAKWLRSHVLQVEDRISFLVLDKHGRAIGHMGYAQALVGEQEMRIDNVVRGVRDVEPGLMTAAMRAMLAWAEEVVRPRQIYVKVFTGNRHAIEFYRRLGFVDSHLVPLRRLVERDLVFYLPLAEGDNRIPDEHHLYMIYRPSGVKAATGNPL